MLFADIRMGEDVNIYPSASFNYVTFGNHVRIGKECHIKGGNKYPVQIGDNTIITMYVLIDGSQAPVIIGKNVSIGQQTVIVSNWQVVEGSRTAKFFTQHAATITIGDETWIGSSCVIAPGVNIGECCIIATNSYVDEDVPSYSIYGGNPARLIKKLTPYELGEAE